jgi:Glu-tRNA(Gln) amidotransferase subunit E-like FAD-binding protein
VYNKSHSYEKKGDNMNEINISRFTASRIVKEYYEEYYFNMVNIKVKPKLENNDLIMIVKKQTKLKGKNISLTETITEGKISNIIKEHMEKKECYINNIIFEPYFHNLNIRYNGNEFNFMNKKGFMKIKDAI